MAWRGVAWRGVYVLCGSVRVFEQRVQMQHVQQRMRQSDAEQPICPAFLQALRPLSAQDVADDAEWHAASAAFFLEQVLPRAAALRRSCGAALLPWLYALGSAR